MELANIEDEDDNNDTDEEETRSDMCLLISKVAKIVRKDIINSRGFSFEGTFPVGCQSDSVTHKFLVSMLLNGRDIKDQDFNDSLASLPGSQVILFNLYLLDQLLILLEEPVGK